MCVKPPLEAPECSVGHGGEARPSEGFKAGQPAEKTAQPGIIALHLHAAQRGQDYYYPHFIDEQPEVQSD